MESWLFGIPATCALAVVALIGYFVGKWGRKEPTLDQGGTRRELKRAKAVIRELEQIASAMRRDLASHHSSVVQFKERVGALSSPGEDVSCQQLSEEAERILKPTLKLANQLAHAYEEIRQQTNHLMSFTEVRTDPLTGLSNRRALDESLLTMMALFTRYGNTFSIAIFDLDYFKKINDEQGHLHGDYVLQQLARLFDKCVRETDIATRYGGEEFVVVMPETDLPGASVFCERMRGIVESKLGLTVSAGIATAVEGDTPRSMLARADAALYGAKAAGRNLVFRHTGLVIESAAVPAPRVAAETVRDVIPYALAE